MTDQSRSEPLRITVLHLLCLFVMHGTFGLFGLALFGHWLGFVGTVALTVAISEVNPYGLLRPR